MDPLARYSGVFFLACWVIATTVLWLRERVRARDAAARYQATRRARLWVALLYWSFAMGGAEELAESGHIRFIGVRVSDPKYVKLFFVLCVVGAACGLAWYLTQLD